MEIQKINMSVCPENQEDVLKVLSVVRPLWNKTDIIIKVFTEGITNRLFGCQLKEDICQKDALVVRIFGDNTDLIIDRQAELQNMQLMHLIGCARPLYAQFNNGLVYGYVPGECLDGSTVRESHIAKLVAREMVKMQGLNPDTLSAGHPQLQEIDKSPCVFTKLERYIQHIPESLPDPEMDRKLREEIPSKDKLLAEMKELRIHLEELGSPVVFAHNDLLLKNIVYAKEEDRTYFIDFEYGGFNYEAYDIAVHFCEYAGIKTVNHNQYPSKDYQLGWLRNFLEFQFQRDGKSPEDVSARDVERLYVQVNKFALLAHLFWGIWGVIQSGLSTLDPNYLNRAVMRFKQLSSKKDEILSLELP